MSPIPLGILALSGVGGGASSVDFLGTASFNDVTEASITGLTAYWAEYQGIEMRIRAQASSNLLEDPIHIDVNGVTTGYYTSRMTLTSATLTGGDSRVNYSRVPLGNARQRWAGGRVLFWKNGNTRISGNFNWNENVTAHNMRFGVFMVGQTNLESVRLWMQSSNTMYAEIEYYGIRGA